MDGFILLTVLTSDEFNSGVAAMIGQLFQAAFMLLQPLFAALGFVVLLYLIIKFVFRKKR